MPRSLVWLLVVGAVLVAAAIVVRKYAAREGRRTIMRFRARVDRFKLTRKRVVVAALLADDEVAAAVRRHAEAHALVEAEVWRRVRSYLDEIVPFFNILAYYRFGYAASRFLLNLLYRVSVEHERADPFRGLPRNAVVIYLMNHRSNADYVLVAYTLAGRVSLSYAVGEWARTFPLEYLFKAFGSYFVRRRYREPLYHSVLERYVQLITRHGVTQGIFPEGGLTRDGTLQRAKIGLLDYVLGVARDPALRERMYLVPVGINYDRVLEDRSLLLELASREGASRPSRWVQFHEVARFTGRNVARLLTRRFGRYGRAAVTIGAPVSVSAWLAEREAGGVSVFALARAERLGQVQDLCDGMMARVGAIIPVTPVCLTAAALQTFDSEFVPREALLERIGEMRAVLGELNARVLAPERNAAEVFDRAYRMLRMRRVVARHGTGYVILPRGRPLLSYYANSIAHLLGPFAAGVRARDALPVAGALGPDGGGSAA